MGFKMKVFILGDINIDLITNIGVIPKAGEDVRADGMQTSIGGAAVNTSVVYSKLTGQAPFLIGCVGIDQFGDELINSLNGNNINCKFVSRSNTTATGQIMVIVTADGERTMISWRGANEQLLPESIQLGMFEGAHGLYVSGYCFLRPPQSEAAVRVIKLAHQTGLHVFVDTAYDPAIQFPQRFHKVFPFIDTLVMGKEDGISLTGHSEKTEMIKSLLESGIRQVALKIGRDGCVLADKHEVVELSGFEVNALDSTGAGDAFCAGLIVATLNELPILQRAVLANALGALSTTVKGSGLNLPGRDALICFLEEMIKKDLRAELANPIESLLIFLRKEYQRE